MRFAFLILLALLALFPAGDARAQALSPAFGGGAAHMTARLEAESMRPAAGQKVTIAIVMTPQSGWHGYWQNPGDAGQALSIDWSLPEGASVGTLRYPVPQTLLVAGLMNHVYEARYAVLSDLVVPAGLRAGTRLPIRAQARWLVCSDTLCVPESGTLALDLVVGEGGKAEPENRTRFDDYRRKLPRPLGGQALFASEGDATVRLAVPYPNGAALSEPHFFPLDEGARSYAGAQRFAREGDTLFVEVRDFLRPSGAVRGVLRIGPDQGVEIAARPGAVTMPEGDIGAGTAGVSQWRVAALALVGAILGGLILNIMPCVFPILSLKAMSLLRSGADDRHARAEAWAYTAGVMATCIALGGIVLALRAGGTQVGWAFQLQSPLVILLLLVLCLAIALNLAGAFALAPVSVSGERMTRRGLSGDFWTGALVAFVATPCTGPFMAAALGSAFVLPVAAAVAVFAGLGLGIALPFLLLAYVPALRSRLPRPGMWMERVQRWLSLPMFVTAAGLLWLLWRQAGVEGLTVGVVVALIFGAALWAIGRSQGRGGRAILMPVAACLLALAGGAAMLHLRSASGSVAAGGFSEAALTSARASGRPLFVYFTADWCLSCKLNEATAIDRDSVRQAFRQADVDVLVGDWTNGDPAITRFLEQHGRSGVPLYLWYPAGGGEPQVLPQILSPDLLVGLARAKS